MKKTHKKVLGLLGLGAVVVTTVFAASLPGPEVAAIESVTDTVTLTVIGTSPDVNITGITSNSITLSPDQPFGINYNDVETVDVVIKYTNKDDVETTINFDTIDAGFQPGSKDYVLPMNDPGFGYGKYVVNVSGTSTGAGDEDSVMFYYYPITAGDITNTDDGKMDVEILYDPINTLDEAEDKKIDHVVVTLYDTDGNPIAEFDPQTVYLDPETNKVVATIDFAGHNLPDGDYIIGLTAYGTNGKPLYKTLYYRVNYKKGGGGDTPIPVPDTGQFMEVLNISKTDYLITGIIAFTIVGLTGAIIIIRRDKKNSREGTETLVRK